LFQSFVRLQVCGNKYSGKHISAKKKHNKLFVYLSVQQLLYVLAEDYIEGGEVNKEEEIIRKRREPKKKSASKQHKKKLTRYIYII
jgi:hypothetical protein